MMNEEEWAKRDSELLDQHALEFDSVCEDHLKSLRFALNSEFPPYPAAHTVTLARAVHALAMRTLADAHPAKHPGGSGFVEAGRMRLQRYWAAVFRINDGVNLAARSEPPSLCLRDRLTALPIQSWRTPSPEHLKEWERAIFSNADKQAAKRRAVEIMFNQPTLDPHFDRGVVVSLAELDAWAIGSGITDDAGVTPLLRAIEAETAERARITAGAIAKERGEAYELTAAPETDGDDGKQNSKKMAPLENWMMNVQAEAAKRWREQRELGCNPTRHSLKDELAKWCRETEVKTTSHIFPTADYLYRHVLCKKHWTPPGN